jgi:DNA-binding beta-propeller fold protein YncE
MIGKLVFGILLLYLLELIFFVHQTIFVTAQQQEQQQYSFVTQWGTEGDGSGQFNNPAGVAVDSEDNVYVTDVNNNRIQKFTANGTFITSWGTEGEGEGQFSGPEGIDIDSQGGVYVADTGNFRIQVFRPAYS